MEFLNNDPIAIDENNVIIEGHRRFEALKQQIADSSPKAKFYPLAENLRYQNLPYFGKHFYFYAEIDTFTVEGVNPDIR